MLPFHDGLLFSFLLHLPETKLEFSQKAGTSHDKPKKLDQNIYGRTARRAVSRTSFTWEVLLSKAPGSGRNFRSFGLNFDR